jgi:hypothetical protein
MKKFFKTILTKPKIFVFILLSVLFVLVDYFLMHYSLPASVIKGTLPAFVGFIIGALLREYIDKRRLKKERVLIAVTNYTKEAIEICQDYVGKDMHFVTEDGYKIKAKLINIDGYDAVYELYNPKDKDFIIKEKESPMSVGYNPKDYTIN